MAIQGVRIEIKSPGLRGDQQASEAQRLHHDFDTLRRKTQTRQDLLHIGQNILAIIQPGGHKKINIRLQCLKVRAEGVAEGAAWIPLAKPPQPGQTFVAEMTKMTQQRTAKHRRPLHRGRLRAGLPGLGLQLRGIELNLTSRRQGHNRRQSRHHKIVQ